MVWKMVIILALIVLVSGTAYLTAAVGRFGLIQKLPKRWQRILSSLALIGAAFAACMFAMSFINAVIVFFHVVFFFLVYGLIVRVISKIAGRKPRVNWQGWLALLTSAGYLAFAFYLCHSVRQTEYRLTSSKLHEPLKIVMFADSHINAVFDGEGFAKHIETINAQNPDIVLIPGDFVDDGTTRSDMIRACEALGTINAKYGVWYTFGNHDRGYYSTRNYTEEELTAELERNHVHVMKDAVECVGDLCIVGREDKSRSQRRTAAELVAEADPEKYIIVLDHQPSDYENEAETAADLVVSGHTHGGQLIPITYVGEWLGMNDRTYGYERRNNTDFIVTSGIADWEMDFKTGTISEYVIITVNS